MPTADRRTALLDATLELIGEGGLAVVTHRRVEARVGLPHGSTTYYFKSKQALLDAAVGRLLEIDTSRADAVGHAVAAALAPRAPLDGVDFAAVAQAISDWLVQDRTLQLARYELQLAAARDEDRRDPMVAGAAAFVRLIEPLVVAAGSQAPERDARIALATVNGLMLEQLTRPTPDFATEILPVALRKLLASFGAP
jgi:AcrR family transcriptional regulator